MQYIIVGGFMRFSYAVLKKVVEKNTRASSHCLSARDSLLDIVGLCMITLVQARMERFQQDEASLLLLIFLQSLGLN
jgi:hypothetical protein